MLAALIAEFAIAAPLGQFPVSIDRYRATYVPAFDIRQQLL